MNKREDTANTKRVELSLHTEYSEMDSTANIRSAILQAAAWGHAAIAVTDHGTTQAFPDAYSLGQKYGIKVIYGVDAYYINDVDSIVLDKIYHLTLLVRNRVGLKNLYELVSKSYFSFHKKHPCICKSLLLNHKDGLIIGSAGDDGEIFDCLENADLTNAEKLSSLYDYLEVRPVCACKQQINLQIAELASRLSKPVVATGNVHYINPEDRAARDVLLFAKEGAQTDEAALYFKTTNEMIEEFSYLGKYCEKAVITNPLLLADTCDSIELFEQGMVRPSIENSKEDLKQLCDARVHKLYGKILPQCVQDRLDWELAHILSNGFDFEYMLAHQLVSRANQQDLPTITRGGACASLVSYLLGISRINPLPPHYRCPNCMHTEFVDTVSNGNDLPDMTCPLCGKQLSKEGYAIPVEAFLALDGDRLPDIDPVFPGDYHKSAENHLREIFGPNHVFRGGQVFSFSHRAAIFHTKKYCEEHHIEMSDEERERIADLLVGVKRDDSCVPGKYVILPSDQELTDYCPSQRNSRYDPRPMAQFKMFDMYGTVCTQDFFCNSTLTKLYELEELTNVKAADIPLNDPLVLQMFANGDFEDDFFEFGVWVKQNILGICQPKSFAEFVKISGFSHGTGVWKDNAELLLKNGTAELSELVTHRDDIFLYLLGKGVPRKEAFRLMEATRKGAIKAGCVKGYREMLARYDIPAWYVESLEKISYLFPKAHSAEYVTLAFQLAWYKVHYEEEYITAKAKLRR